MMIKNHVESFMKRSSDMFKGAPLAEKVLLLPFILVFCSNITESCYLSGFNESF